MEVSLKICFEVGFKISVIRWIGNFRVEFWNCLIDIVS